MIVLLIIAQNGYQDYEYSATKRVLQENGVEVVTASKNVGTCHGSHGSSVEATISLDDVKVSDYDAIAFIGGPGAVAYQQDMQAHLVAQQTLTAGKVLGAICIAPTILALARVLDGKSATVWNEDNEQYKVLESGGAEFTNEDVTVDGNIVTANGPPAAEKFALKILEVLQQ